MLQQSAKGTAEQQNNQPFDNKKMASTLTNLLYHVVFSTKGRLQIIDDSIANDLHAYMGGIVRKHGGIPIQIGGIRDHVHMLIKLNSSIPLSDMVRLVKAGSSKWLNERFQNMVRFGWQAGYGGFSVSESVQERVRQYIQNQEHHHLKQSFDDEYKALLERHGIAYDPQYVLD